MKLITVALTLASLITPAAAQGWLPRMIAAGTPTPGTMLYERLQIGSGGFGTSLDIANDGTRVFWTDISNGYVMPVGETIWRSCVTETLMPTPPGLGFNAWGVTSMAVAKNDSQRLYMFYAPADGSKPPTYLYRNDSQCATPWVLTDFPVSAGPNGIGSNRISGQMIAVDPHNKDIVYINHAVHGTMRSVDGGVCFEAVAGIPPSNSGTSYGGMGLRIDEYSGTTTLTGTCKGTPYSVTATNKVYIPVFGKGVWASTDGGNNFGAITSGGGGGPHVEIQVSTTEANTVIVLTARAFSIPRIENAVVSSLTFIPRFTNHVMGSSWRVSEWYAIAPTPLTNESIKVYFEPPLTAASNFPSVTAVAIKGADTSNPFDSGGVSNVPKLSTAFTSVMPNAASTSSANTLMYAWFINGTSGAGTPFGPTGWDCVEAVGPTTSCNGFDFFTYKINTTTQTNISPTVTGSTGGLLRGGFIDAVRASGSGTLGIDSVTRGSTLVLPPDPYLVMFGQVGCDGIYYVSEKSHIGWKWNGSVWSQLPYSSQGVAPMHNLASPDCARVDNVTAFATVYSRSADSGATWPVNRNLTSTNSSTVVATNAQWYEYTIPGTSNSLFLGDAMYNPATGNLEMATGFCYFVIPGGMPASGTVTYNELCAGAESVVPYKVASVPGGATYFAMRDVGMFANLQPDSWPVSGLPVRNYSAGGLTQCTDVQYSGLNPQYVFAICTYDLSNSGYTTTGGTHRNDWKMFGGHQNGYTNAGNPPGFVPPGTSSAGGSIAPNACDPNNVIWSQGATSGQNYRTENALTVMAQFTGSVTSNVLTVTAVTSGTIQAGQELYLLSTSTYSSRGTLLVLQPHGTGGTTGTGGIGTYAVVGSYGNITSQTLFSSVHWQLIPNTAFTPSTSAGVPYGWGHGTGDSIFFKRHPVAADKVTCDTFYAYNSGTQRTYVSRNRGQTWTTLATGVPGLCEKGYLKLETVHGKAGWLYATSGFGIIRPQPDPNCRFQWLRDDGVSASGWNSCPDLTEIFGFSMGKAKPDSSYGPTVIANGVKGLKEYGTWFSDDDCQTWRNVAPAPDYGQPPGDRWNQYSDVVGGDMNEYGTVYLGLSPGAGFTRGRLQ